MAIMAGPGHLLRLKGTTGCFSIQRGNSILANTAGHKASGPSLYHSCTSLTLLAVLVSQNRATSVRYSTAALQL